MASIFRKDDQFVEKQKRNVFYKTYESNLTTNFGKIIPAFCKPVMIGETVKLDPKMSFNFLPLVFPVQNRVRAVLQFYYVRNRNLWDGWKDFQFKMKDGLVPPYHVFRKETYKEMLKVGGLLDNLGVPVVLHGDYIVRLAPPEIKHSGEDGWYYDAVLGSWTKQPNYQTFNFANPDDSNNDSAYYDWYQVATSSSAGQASVNIHLFNKPVKVDADGYVTFDYRPGREYAPIRFIVNRRIKGEVVVDRSVSDSNRENTRKNITSSSDDRVSSIGAVSQSDKRSVSSSSNVVYDSDSVVETGIWSFDSALDDDENYVEAPFGIYEILGYIEGTDQGQDYDVYMHVNVDYQYGEQGVPLSFLTLDSLPFPYYGDSGNIIDSDDRLHISSMPARAIQSVYNAFVRNETNNPFMVDGQPEYNKYITNDSGGPDGDFYPLYKRNWQDDCFTTALHSPQHGVAPLVGLRTNEAGTERVLVVFDNDDGTKVPVHMTTNDADEVVAVSAASPQDEYANTLANALMEGMTNFGMSINDFRNVNSYQRWLENNVRKGYKYPDQIKAHTGVSVKYNILDMPEYIGGMSRDMQVQQVTQTTENDYGNLGDFSGQAWINGEMEHSIEHFCDEEGFIIGLLSIDPVAPYSQVIPKYLLRESAFDYYASEFSKIGMQPILNREIAPLQSFYEKNGLKVFGYQRAWYDSLDGLSEVHGKFRTDFRNFIISRTFGSVPELSEDFLTMDVDDINNIFYVDDEEDKILGQILFKYESLLPIPVYGIPALE